jgi:nitrogen-specific signal transduction histidine kinase
MFWPALSFTGDFPAGSSVNAPSWPIRLQQADPGTTRERRGLGLGLAIARQIAEMHGGTIDVSSAGGFVQR